MANVSLECLPAEILLLICEYLGTLDAKSLLSFALSSKQIHRIAKQSLYSQLEISITHPDQVGMVVTASVQQLKRTSTFACIDRLLLYYYKIEENEFKNDQSGIPSKAIQLRPKTWSKEVSLHSYWIQHNRHFEERCADVTSFNEAQTVVERLWEPMAVLITQLPALRDVVFDSMFRMPLCILQSLHEVHQSCRLHLRNFRFSSFNWAATKVEHEYKLLTSPNLYSISVRNVWYGSMFQISARDEYCDSILRRIASGVASNVREIAHHQSMVFNSAWGLSPTWQTDVFPPPQIWSNVINTEVIRPPQKPLQKLKLLTSSSNNVLGMPEWIQCIDFTKLEELHIHSSFADDDLRMLSNQPRFSSLSILSIMCHPRFDSSERNDQALAGFLRNVSPLRCLELHGSMGDESFRAIGEHHSSNLRAFKLRSDELGLLREQARFETICQCTLLEKVDIIVPLVGGELTAKTMTDLLGSRLPRLQHLSIQIEAQFGVLEEYIKSGKPDFIKYCTGIAPDGNLAKEIFERVSHAKTCDSAPLETLKARMNTGSNYVNGGGGRKNEWEHCNSRSHTRHNESLQWRNCSTMPWISSSIQS